LAQLDDCNFYLARCSASDLLFFRRFATSNG